MIIDHRLQLTNSRREEEEVLKRVSLLQDCLLGHSDLVSRHGRGVNQDHKKAAEKMANIKRKNLQGIMASNVQLYEEVERRVREQEVVLNDLETRQAFGVLCLEEETTLVRTYLLMLENIVDTMGRVEGTGLQDIGARWSRISLGERKK